jgi:hypothetical protein
MDKNENKEVQNDEQLNKSIDSLIDELFAEDSADVEKSMNAIDDIVGAPKQTKKEILAEPKNTADEAVNETKKPKKDERPIKEVSDVPENDQDGSRAKGYEAVQSANPAKDVANEKQTIAKSDKIEISKEDAEFLAKAKQAQKDEELKKAKTEQEDLIKSLVAAQTEELKKALTETTDLVKSLKAENDELRSRPKVRKSIANINDLQALEKGQQAAQRTSYSQDELLDAAEELHKAKKIRMEEVIELENNGTIFNPQSRKLVEDYLKNK